jgi:hypothetical protein
MIGWMTRRAVGSMLPRGGGSGGGSGEVLDEQKYIRLMMERDNVYERIENVCRVIMDAKTAEGGGLDFGSDAVADAVAVETESLFKTGKEMDKVLRKHGFVTAFQAAFQKDIGAAVDAQFARNFAQEQWGHDCRCTVEERPEPEGLWRMPPPSGCPVHPE